MSVLAWSDATFRGTLRIVLDGYGPGPERCDGEDDDGHAALGSGGGGDRRGDLVVAVAGHGSGAMAPGRPADRPWRGPRPVRRSHPRGNRRWGCVAFDMAGSWAVTRAGLDLDLVRGIGAVLIAVTVGALALAALSTVGLIVPSGWWQPTIVLGATASAAMLVLFFEPQLVLGLGIDAVLLWVVATRSVGALRRR